MPVFFCFLLIFSSNLLCSYEIKPISEVPVECFSRTDSRLFFLTERFSGTHWTLYILGHFSHRPVSSDFSYCNFFDQEVDFSDPFIHHFHDIKKVYDPRFLCAQPNSYKDKLLMVVRNPRESILKKNSIDEVESYLTEEGVFTLFSLLEYFDGWPEESRYLFYYEDMLTEPRREIVKLLNFIEAPLFEVDLFIEAIDFHKQNSLVYYDAHHGSSSKGNDVDYHSKKYSDDELIELNRKLRNISPYLWDKYLWMYDIDGGEKHNW